MIDVDPACAELEDDELEVLDAMWYDGPVSRVSVVLLRNRKTNEPEEIRLRVWVAPRVGSVQMKSEFWVECLERLKFWEDIFNKGELEAYLGILEMQKDAK